MTGQKIPLWMATALAVLALALTTTAFSRDLRTELVVDNGDQHFTFQVELAMTALERRIGLQGRETMANDAGMLLLFDPPARASVWMKDTYIALDILFINSDGRVQNIVEAATPLSLTPIQSTHSVSAVLELKGGTSRKLGLKPGNQVIYQ